MENPVCGADQLLLYLFLNVYLFIHLAPPGLSCGMWDLIPSPGIEPGTPVLGARSLSHRTTGQVPDQLLAVLLSPQNPLLRVELIGFDPCAQGHHCVLPL